MNKLAQRRGFFSKLREKANISGKILENLNEEFKTVMDNMRSTDEKVRTIADTLKGDLKEAKTFLNRRDYLNSALKLSEFHGKAKVIIAHLEYFKKNVDIKHYNFLLSQLDEGQKETLFGYDPKKKVDVLQVDDMMSVASLESRAGKLSDIWYNIFSDKGQAMSALEKRFSVSFLKDLKTNTIDMNVKSAQFLTALLQAFSKMETGVSTRNVDLYVRELDILIKKFTSYHTQFIRYFDKSVAPLKQKYEEIKAGEREMMSRKQMEKEQEENRIAADLRERAERVEQQHREEQAAHTRAPSPSITNIPEPSKLTPDPSEKLMYEEPAEISDEEEPFDLVKSEEPFPLVKKEEFIAQLEKLSNPMKMAQEILKYSAQIENYDNEASLKLLSIAEGIIEEYKVAGVFGQEMPGASEGDDKEDPLV
jgi:hypothetical protein